MRFVRPENADAAIDVALSGRVTYWTVVPMKVEISGIVVIVLVFRKTMVLKDGQLVGTTFPVRYVMLATSRFSVVNLGRFLNTVAGGSVVMEGDNVMEDSLDPVNVSAAIVASMLLRDKSKEPERFTHLRNASAPSVVNDIGAKVSTPVPEQSLNAEAPIDIMVDGNVPDSLGQVSNVLTPIVVSLLLG